MKRLIGLLAASALVASVGMLASSPASAQTICAGTGTAELSDTTGLGFPPPLTITTPDILYSADGKSADFDFDFTAGGCTNGGLPTPLTASGSLTGWCGWSNGSGTANGNAFDYISRGTFIGLTGAITGAVSAIEDPIDAPSCRLDNATNFLITGLATY